MPLIANTELPSYERLRGEGFEVLSAAAAAANDIPALHIGVLNLMPDAALQATERQFLRLLSAGRRLANVYVHFFTVPGVGRQGPAEEHVATHYETFETVKREGLNALLVTGANPANPVLSNEGFWDGLIEVVEWARDNVCSTLCSCLATHAVVQHYHGIERIKLPEKRWGVYSHRLLTRDHPLVRRVNTRFDAPHSHVYEVTEAQLAGVGIHVLAVSEEAGVHLAVSHDGFKFIYFQGHPEYDDNSLLKEYKREVMRFSTGVRADFAPLPLHYFTAEVAELLTSFRQRLTDSTERPAVFEEFPEKSVEALLENTWTDTGMAVFSNWLDLVYDISDRAAVYREGIDAHDPLRSRPK